jgi:hypothetical protein
MPEVRSTGGYATGQIQSIVKIKFSRFIAYQYEKANKAYFKFGWEKWCLEISWKKD